MGTHDTPSPGSEEAIKQGRTCPVLDNNHGEGMSCGLFWIDLKCPLHGRKE